MEVSMVPSTSTNDQLTGATLIACTLAWSQLSLLLHSQQLHAHIISQHSFPFILMVKEQVHIVALVTSRSKQARIGCTSGSHKGKEDLKPAMLSSQCTFINDRICRSLGARSRYFVLVVLRLHEDCIPDIVPRLYPENHVRTIFVSREEHVGTLRHGQKLVQGHQRSRNDEGGCSVRGQRYRYSVSSRILSADRAVAQCHCKLTCAYLLKVEALLTCTYRRFVCNSIDNPLHRIPRHGVLECRDH
mmetsp:Transcript_15619/g.22646  ORF Transcript_15619/g.22646 Transcript_15619/m.22646 type:complete len:245 (+) Transcript_15619:1503-2237(+)